MKHLLRRLRQSEPELAVELIERGMFPKRDLRELARDLRTHKIMAPEPGRRAYMEARAQALRAAISRQLSVANKAGNRKPNSEPPCAKHAGFIPLLARADSQLATQAVISCPMTDLELHQLACLLNLQHDGPMLRQVRVAVELEIERRKLGAVRGGKNRVKMRRG